MVNNIPEQDLERIVVKGYAIDRAVLKGEGHTRHVYEVPYSSGPFEEKRILKVPKPVESVNSITALLNLANMNVNENEIACLQQISHPNIVRMLDCIPLSDGRLVNVEESFAGISIQDYVDQNGPFPDHLMKMVFPQVFDGLIHLGAEHTFFGDGYFHRDIKPSNILFNPETGIVKITDLQNARRKKDIQQKVFATKGGAAYTHPELLNAILGDAAGASIQTEAYSLAATIYFALKGVLPFDYKIIEDKKGFPIQIGSKTVTVSLCANGDPVKKITPELHKENLSTAIEGMNIYGYRGFFENTFSFGESNEKEKGNSVTSHSPVVSFIDMKNGYEDIHKEDPLARLAKNWKKTLVCSLVSLAILGIGYAGLRTHFVNVGDNARIEKLYQEQTAAEMYKKIFTQSFSLAKRALEEGQVDASLSLSDELIARKAKEYGIDADIVKNIYKANKYYADCLLVGRKITTGVVIDNFHGIEIFDPFIVYNPGGRGGPIVDQEQNLDLGLNRLSKLVEKYGGDVKVALNEFYDPQKSDDILKNRKYMLGQEMSITQQTVVRDLARLLAYNANKHGYKKTESAGGMAGSSLEISFENPSFNWKVSSPSRGL